MVYFIREEGTHNVKVGYSSCPSNRAYDLQCGNSRELILEAQAAGDRCKEQLIQEYLRDNGKHVRGEWYKMTKKAVRELMSIKPFTFNNLKECFEREED